MNQKVRDIKRCIINAFKDLRPPASNMLVQGDDGDSEDIQKAFNGKHWRDIDFDFVLYEFTESLFFFSPSAYRFYLPAYLMMTLDNYSKADIIPDIIIATLQVPDNPTDDLFGKGKIFERLADDISRERSKFELFTPEQKHAIRLFLEYMAKNHKDDFHNNEPQEALKCYWNKF